MPEAVGQGQSAPEVGSGDDGVLSRLQSFVGEDEEMENESPEEPVEAQGEEQSEDSQAEEASAEQEKSEEIPLDLDAPLVDVTVKLEGGGEETRKVSINEMRLGYMRREDYQRKTAEVARERDGVEQVVDERLSSERGQYVQNLQVMQKALWQFAQGEFANADFARLARDNPAAAVEFQARAQEFNQILGEAQEELQRVTAQEQAKAAKAFQEATRRCVEVLQSEVPGWGAEMVQAISATGKSEYGFTQEELNTLSDPRMIKVLVDAHKYRQLQAAKPAIKNKVVSAPKMMKPGAKEESKGPGPDLQRQRAAFKKSGNLRDGAKFLEHFL